MDILGGDGPSGTAIRAALSGILVGAERMIDGQEPLAIGLSPSHFNALSQHFHGHSIVACPGELPLTSQQRKI